MSAKQLLFALAALQFATFFWLTQGASDASFSCSDTADLNEPKILVTSTDTLIAEPFPKLP